MGFHIPDRWLLYIENRAQYVEPRGVQRRLTVCALWWGWPSVHTMPSPAVRRVPSLALVPPGCLPHSQGQGAHTRQYLRWAEWVDRVMQGRQVPNAIRGASWLHVALGVSRPVPRGAGRRWWEVTTNRDRPAVGMASLDKLQFTSLS